MKVLLEVARVYVGVIGAAGFLFGQLFSGTFTVGATIAGSSGIVSAILGHRSSSNGRQVAVAACALGLLGVALDALRYYTKVHSPGNYYAWFFIGPFVAGLAFIGYLNVSSANKRVVV